MTIATRALFFVLLLPIISMAQTAGVTEAPPPGEISSPASSKAEQSPTGSPTEKKQTGLTRIIYGSSPWNLDSTKIDSAFLFMRDKNTNKVVKILLEETEPDSSLFQGEFQLQTTTGEHIEPEVYIPPKELRDTDKAVAKFFQLFEQKKIKSKPLIVRETASGQRIYDVYDTPEQAASAQKAFNREQKALDSMASMTKPQAPVASGKVLDASGLKDLSTPAKTIEATRYATQQKLLNQLALEAAQREAERVRLEQIERQRALERENQARLLSEKQRQARIRHAQEYANRALAHYNLGEFKEAEENFAKSVELDPTNTEHYFRYGVTLYRNNKFNEALVVLKLSKEDPSTRLEKQYYMGLIHFRLKELDSALGAFREVAEAKDPSLSPSGSFYQGVILYSQEKYELAKRPFEIVLDTSKDPRLDQQAEEYLEKIAQVQQQEKRRGKKYSVNATAGLTYDSNVLLAPDNNETSQGSSLNSSDVRLILAGDGEYRLHETRNSDVSAKAMLYYLYSSKDEVSIADPFLANISLPYVHKGELKGKGHKLTLSPGYEAVFMDANDDGTRESILNSIILSIDSTLIMSPTWFASYIIEIRQDDSKTAESDESNNADAMRFNLKTNQTFIINKARKEILVGSLGLTSNQAVGNNKFYNRYDLGANYFVPFKWGQFSANWIAGLGVYQLDFSKADTTRKDFNTTLTTGVSKPMGERWNWTLIATYTKNNSDVITNDYSKYTVMTTATYSFAK